MAASGRINMISRGPVRGFLKNIAERLKHNQKTREWVYHASVYPKLGLMTHDCISLKTPLMKEAAKRLPKDVMSERQFRISRAVYLSIKGDILPQEEWMKIEDDKPYMAPYINTVELELAEEKHYQKKIYKPFYKLQNVF